MKRLLSGRSSTCSRLAGSVKLGQPVPESNLVSEENSSAPQQTQRYMPLALLVHVGPGEGALGARLAGHLVLLGRQLLAPLRVCTSRSSPGIKARGRPEPPSGMRRRCVLMALFFESATATSFVATELTRGPWDPGAQHAGPPAALLGREIERLAGRRGVPGRPGHLRDPAPGADRAGRGGGRGGAAGPAGAVGRGVAERRRRRADARQRLADAHRARSSCRPRRLAAARPAARARSRARARVLPDRPGGRLSLGDGGPFRRGRLPRARPGDGLDADAPAACRRRGADAAAADAGRGRRRQRDQRRLD